MTTSKPLKAKTTVGRKKRREREGERERERERE
jgi:hypothetical protein